MTDIAYWMGLALEQAEQAGACDEVPVGAVVVRDGKLLGIGYNQPISAADPTAHAEIVAMRAAARALENYRLAGCELYVTIEPCSMCLGAMVHARIAHLYFGAREPRAGAALSHFGLHDRPELNHRLTVTEGVREPECAALIRDFFKTRR